LRLLRFDSWRLTFCRLPFWLKVASMARHERQPFWVLRGGGFQFDVQVDARVVEPATLILIEVVEERTGRRLEAEICFSDLDLQGWDAYTRNRYFLRLHPAVVPPLTRTLHG